ncbi:MAG: hypothetical protein HY321_07480 [Armatimonadetes bacterium]|nr:hypothetical protein [Armatimonadota bacterium]
MVLVSGTPLFRMALHMDVPHEVSVARLREELDRVAETENVDIELRPE